MNKSLTPAAVQVLTYIERVGSISAQEAFLNLHGMTSATLSRRITEIRRNAEPGIEAIQHRNQSTGKLYTRYYGPIGDLAFPG